VAETRFQWDGDTTPFFDAEGRTPASFALRQVTRNDFELTVPFSFRTSTGDTFAVTPELLGPTDIASVPSFLGWFARRHGDHTPAALLHDQLITTAPALLPENQRLRPADADLIFRQAMRDCGVPVVKAWIMWSAVALRTRWHHSPLAAAAIVLWFLAALTGTALAVAGLLTARPGLTVVALLAPFPFSVLWGAQWQAALVAGYAFWLAVFGSGPAFLAYHVYWLIEAAVRVARGLHPANRGPDADLAMPPAFKDR
jgi:hypothetical protein